MKTTIEAMYMSDMLESGYPNARWATVKHEQLILSYIPGATWTKLLLDGEGHIWDCDMMSPCVDAWTLRKDLLNVDTSFLRIRLATIR